MGLHLIVFSLLLSSAFCNESGKKLIRNKRWGKSEMGNSESASNPRNMNNNNNGDLSNNFRGTAGVDYPDFKTIPTTNFRCDDQIYEGGLYADVETQCQVYHVCHEGRKDSFICGKGTVFNQEILACDYWYSTDCDKAPSFYYVNAQIGSNGNAGSSYVPQSGNNNQVPSNSYGSSNYRSDYPVGSPSQGNVNNQQNQPNSYVAQPGNNNQEPSHNYGNSNYGSDYPAASAGHGNVNNQQNQPSSYVPQPVNNNQKPSNNYGTSNYGSDYPVAVPGHRNINNQQNQPNSYGDNRPALPAQNRPGLTGQTRPDSPGQNRPVLPGHSSGQNDVPPAMGIGSNYNDQQNPSKDCSCCQKYSVQSPWEFPSGQANIG